MRISLICTVHPISFGYLTSRRIGLVEHIARNGKRIGAYKILVGKPEGRNHLEALGIEGRIILKWIVLK